MIARIWRGVIPAPKGEKYLELLRGAILRNIWQRRDIAAIGTSTAPKMRSPALNLRLAGVRFSDS